MQDLQAIRVNYLSSNPKLSQAPASEVMEELGKKVPHFPAR